jgi:hypothetical protein
MRARLATLAAALMVFGALIPAVTSIAQAQSPQETTDGSKGKEGQEDAKSGGPADKTTEEGPPWTYQMARLGLLILFFLAISMGGLYYRFVVLRQRGEV